jgi:hypothetical protein
MLNAADDDSYSEHYVPPSKMVPKAGATPLVPTATSTAPKTTAAAPTSSVATAAAKAVADAQAALAASNPPPVAGGQLPSLSVQPLRPAPTTTTAVAAAAAAKVSPVVSPVDADRAKLDAVNARLKAMETQMGGVPPVPCLGKLFVIYFVLFLDEDFVMFGVFHILLLLLLLACYVTTTFGFH